MSMTRAQRLQAEISMLREMLQTIAPGRVIERVGIESRAESLQAELAALGAREPKRLDLTFSGEPVEGSRSIVADFAARAVAMFCDAVAVIMASHETSLGATGRLPTVTAPPLRILGPALGSFGFELEIPNPPPPLSLSLIDILRRPEDADNPTLLAVEETMALITAAQSGDDEDKVYELLAEMHTRAALKVRDFVKLLVDRRASVALQLGERRVAIAGVDAARRVVERLSMDVITENAVVDGYLWVLPSSRQFELHGGSEIVKGKVDRWLASPEKLPNGGEKVRAEIRKTRVGGKKPNYVLISATIPE